MRYGELPVQLGTYELDCKEMMFYQYLPIKMPGQIFISYEPRLSCFEPIINKALFEFLLEYGHERYNKSYVYLTAKVMFQMPGGSFNRPGYHSDGFLTADINYVWCDRYPTVFNNSDFKLSLDDSKSLTEMEEQADPNNEIVYPENTLLRLNQYNIHKVADITSGCVRSFVKISISTDKYDLIGNSHNHLMDYKWDMKDRRVERNIPQSSLGNTDMHDKSDEYEVRSVEQVKMWTLSLFHSSACLDMHNKNKATKVAYAFDKQKLIDWYKYQLNTNKDSSKFIFNSFNDDSVLQGYLYKGDPLDITSEWVVESEIPDILKYTSMIEIK